MPRRNRYWPGAWLATCGICGRTRYNHELRRGVSGPEQGLPCCYDTCWSPRHPIDDHIKVDRPESRPTWPRSLEPGALPGDAGQPPGIPGDGDPSYTRPLTYEEIGSIGGGYGFCPYGAWGKFSVVGDYLMQVFVP